MDLSHLSPEDRSLVARIQASIEEARSAIENLSPVPDDLPGEERERLSELRESAIQSWRETIETWRGAQRHIIDPAPPSPEQEAARAQLVQELVEKARDQCPPVVAEYDALSFAERAKETLAALRRLEWRAAVGKPDQADDVNRGYLEAELAFLERSQALGVHRSEPRSTEAVTVDGDSAEEIARDVHALYRYCDGHYMGPGGATWTYVYDAVKEARGLSVTPEQVRNYRDKYQAGDMETAERDERVDRLKRDLPEHMKRFLK